MDAIAADITAAEPRLRSLQRQLVELIDLLDLIDPDGVRFPQFHRQVYGDEAESAAPHSD